MEDGFENYRNEDPFVIQTIYDQQLLKVIKFSFICLIEFFNELFLFRSIKLGKTYLCLT
jgi:hypothetical protein